MSPRPRREEGQPEIVPSETEVATTEDNAVAVTGSVDLAAYGVDPSHAAPGTEQIAPEDIELPRIRLIQGQSRECTDFEPGTEGFRPIGTLVHSGSDKVLLPFPNGDNKLRLLPLMLLRQRIWFDDGRLIARSLDAVRHSPNSPARADGITICAQCPDALWTPDPENPRKNKPPKCGVQYVLPSLIIEEVEAGRIEEALVALTLAKTSAPEAKKLITAVGMSRLPFFAFPVNVTTWKDSNDSGTFGRFTVKRQDRLAPDSPLYAAGKNVYEMLKNVTVTIEVDDNIAGDFLANDDAGSAPAGDAPTEFDNQF